MIALALCLLAADVPLPLPLPPVEDINLFPSNETCWEEIDRWRRHLGWLHMAESVAMPQHREQFRLWYRQTRDIIGLWNMLTEANCRYLSNQDEDARRCLLSLWTWLGPEAYYSGRLPRCPLLHDCEPWQDE